MRFIRLSALVKMAFSFYLVWRQSTCFTRVSASLKTSFAFSLVWGHNACVSHAFLHRSRRLLRVTIHAIYTLVCIYCDGFCVFLRIALHCMRFTRLAACNQTGFVFSSYRVTIHAFHTHVCIGQDGFSLSFVWCRNTCVSHACLHWLRLLRFPSYGVTMYAFHMRVCIG